MGDVVNLNRYRKLRDRRRRETEAAENRTKFGRSKPEKAKDRHDAEQDRRGLDGKKLDDPA